jgi:hypothetical protein
VDACAWPIHGNALRTGIKFVATFCCICNKRLQSAARATA